MNSPTDLTAADREQISETPFRDIVDWRSRLRAGETRLYEQSKDILLSNFDALMAYTRDLKRQLEESKDHAHIRELERMVDSQASQIRRLEDSDGGRMRIELRRKQETVNGLRKELVRCWRRQGINRELPGEFDG